MCAMIHRITNGEVCRNVCIPQNTSGGVDGAVMKRKAPPENSRYESEVAVR